MKVKGAGTHEKMSSQSSLERNQLAGFADFFRDLSMRKMVV